MKFFQTLLLILFVSTSTAIQCFIGTTVGSGSSGIIKSEQVPGSTTGATVCVSYQVKCTGSSTDNAGCKNIPAGTTVTLYAPFPSCDNVPSGSVNVQCCSTDYCNAVRSFGIQSVEISMILVVLMLLL